ncbi:MAG: family 20 glycosylhydrolase, partial [Clostridia bacterium]|nr:family 20 glycosylhydrolase [Clostridia bacterium]
MKWTYLIHLGVNMWKGPKGDTGPLGFYADKMITEHSAWREIIDFIAAQGVNTLIIDVAEGLKYESHPELATEGAWSKEFLKKELDYIRSLGITPIPKLNFSTLHDSWLKEYSVMVSTPKYYQVVDDLIKEVGEVFDTPEYFHIGMDEEAYNPYLSFWYIDMQVKQGQTVVRPNTLFWEDLKYIASCVEKHGMNVWTWGCMIWV